MFQGFIILIGYYLYFVQGVFLIVGCSVIENWICEVIGESVLVDFVGFFLSCGVYRSVWLFGNCIQVVEEFGVGEIN